MSFNVHMCMSLTCVLALLGSFCGDLSVVLQFEYKVIKQTSGFALLCLDAEVIVQSSLSFRVHYRSISSASAIHNTLPVTFHLSSLSPGKLGSPCLVMTGPV